MAVVLSILGLAFTVGIVHGDGTVYGGGGCVPVYGGGVSCPRVEEFVDKTLWNKVTKTFVEGLGPNDDIGTRFTAGEEVQFRLQVKNTGDQLINRIVVKDSLPPFSQFVAGPGIYSPSDRSLTFTIDNLPANAVSEHFIKVKVVSENELPKDSTLICGKEGIVNRVRIDADNRAPKFDETPFCIGKPSSPQAPSIPSAGVEDIVFPGLVTLLSGGLYLMRKAKLS